MLTNLAIPTATFNKATVAKAYIGTKKPFHVPGLLNQLANQILAFLRSMSSITKVDNPVRILAS